MPNLYCQWTLALLCCTTLWLCGTLSSTAEHVVPSESEWTTTPAPVDDPIGLGERLALIDYLQEERQLSIPPGSTLDDLRKMYWEHFADQIDDQAALQRDQHQRLIHQLTTTFHIDIPQDLSYQELLKLKKELERKQLQENQKAIAELQLNQDKQKENTGTDLRSLQKSVVMVLTQNSSGTGWISSARGHIITNAHVINNVGQAVHIHWTATLKEDPLPYRVKKIWEHHDLALLEPTAESPNMPFLRLQENPQVTNEVVALGFPLGTHLGSTLGSNAVEITSSVGHITALRHRNESLYWIQTDCKLSPGNSGGPLIDRATGRVVGVMTAGVRSEEATIVGNVITVAVPASEVRAAFRDFVNF